MNSISLPWKTVSDLEQCREIISAQTYTVPSAPVQSIAVLEVTPESVSVSWEPPDFFDQNGVIIYYVVNVTVPLTGEAFTIEPESANATLSGLHPFRTYVCRFAAATAVGVGPFSEPLSVTTEESGNAIY